MNNYKVSILQSNPGIQRDGTAYDSENFIDGQWVRFYNNKPRKMGGYKAVNYGTDQIIRNMYSLPYTDNIQVYLGRASSLSYINLPINNIIDIESVSEVNRTPVDFVDNVNNMWSFDSYTTGGDSYDGPQIIAVAIKNLNDINNEEEGQIYYGPIGSSTALIPIQDTTGMAPINITCSGGIVFISPLLVTYGKDGIIFYNNPNVANSLNSWTDSDGNRYQATISNTKIIYGAPVIGSNDPTALFWSLNQLLRVTFIAATALDDTVFYDTQITTIDSCTIMSANCVVGYKQTYFWIGTDQFYMFNGVVQPIPNTMNRDWFFNNVNLEHRNKIFAIVDPRYNEIKWYFPYGDATENNAFIGYSLEGNFWFDSMNGRSAGISPSVFPKPLLADSQATPITTRRGVQNLYLLWEHETGTDKVISNRAEPIVSHYTHHIMDIFSNQGGENRLTRSRRVETDIRMSGNMTLSVINLMWPADYYNGNAIIDGPFTFDQNTPYIDMASQGRLVALRFESNELGGFYQAGKTLYDWEVGDVNP